MVYETKRYAVNELHAVPYRRGGGCTYCGRKIGLWHATDCPFAKSKDELKEEEKTEENESLKFIFEEHESHEDVLLDDEQKEAGKTQSSRN